MLKDQNIFHKNVYLKKFLRREDEERYLSGIVLKPKRVRYVHMFEFTVFPNTWYALIFHQSYMINITSTEIK